MGRIKGDQVSMMISQTRRQINTFEKKEKNKKSRHKHTYPRGINVPRRKEKNTGKHNFTQKQRNCSAAATFGHWSVQERLAAFCWLVLAVNWKHLRQRLLIPQWHFSLRFTSQGEQGPGWHRPGQAWAQPAPISIIMLLIFMQKNTGTDKRLF